MADRKLVTVRQINGLHPIPGADLIEVAEIDGWRVVVKKQDFKIGDYCAYFEIDSFLPENDPRYAFLMPKGVKEFEGVRGHKLRTVKLKGQISQGLVLPLALFYKDFDGSDEDEGQELSEFFTLGTDLTRIVGIKKYEAPIPASLAGQVKGSFPSFMRKTDQERCQNLIDEIWWQNKGSEYEVTIKLDGTSGTFYHYNGEVGACSRNLELKINEENKDNTFIKLFKDAQLDRILPVLGNVAIQGEVMGPGIQGNREALKAPKFFIFDIQNLDEGRYLTPDERFHLVSGLKAGGLNTDLVDHVPVLHSSVSLETLGLTNVEDLLKYAEGTSINNLVREGLVFKRSDGKFSFKAISNAFLAKEKD